MNAYVLFKTLEEVAKALELNNEELKGRHLRITHANQKEIDTKTTIFVGNLPFSTEEEEIRKYFNECGTIDYIRLIRDRKTHQAKGVCYIKFADKYGYFEGLKKNLQKYKEREIRVTKAMVMGENKKPLK